MTRPPPRPLPSLHTPSRRRSAPLGDVLRRGAALRPAAALWALALTGLCACGEERDLLPAYEPGGLELRFGAGASDPDFHASPFPGRHRLDKLGHLSLDNHPNPNAILWVDAVAAVLGQERAAPQTGMFRLAFTGALHTADLAPSALAGADAAIIIVDLATQARAAVQLEARFFADGGPFGAPNLLTLQPRAGERLAPGRFAVMVRRGLRSADGGSHVGPSASMYALLDGRCPAPMPAATCAELRGAIDLLVAAGHLRSDIAAVFVVEVGDATATLRAMQAAAATQVVPGPTVAFALTDTFPNYCVFESRLLMPTFQQGQPPFTGLDGGGGVEVQGDLAKLAGHEEARLWLTVPRQAMPGPGWPTVVFIRTGGGGDRPLIDRGRVDAAGALAEGPGSGLARTFAAAGFAGLMWDGPLGGLRNPTGGDEQLLVFNFNNPVALRDNVVQSGFEAWRMAAVAEGLEVDVSACKGATPTLRIDGKRLGLFGHSMGATIAPLALAGPESPYDFAILSGAGANYGENILHKRKPLVTRPLAEALIGYAAVGRALEPGDPLLGLVQGAAERADPPVYPRPRGKILILQGIVDNYILPPMANALARYLDLPIVGTPLDAGAQGLKGFESHAAAGLRLGAAPYTVGADRGGIVHLAEDALQDGHEAAFQSPVAAKLILCWLKRYLQDGVFVIAPEGC